MTDDERLELPAPAIPEYWLSLQNAVDLYDAQKCSAAFPRQAKRPRPMAIEQACAQ